MFDTLYAQAVLWMCVCVACKASNTEVDASLQELSHDTHVFGDAGVQECRHDLVREGYLRTARHAKICLSAAFMSAAGKVCNQLLVCDTCAQQVYHML